MTTATESNTLGDLLMIEVHRGWSRQRGTITGADLALGTVLAKVSGKYQQLDPAGSGGAEVVAAVLAEDVNAAAADLPGVVIARGAVINSAALVWPTGTTDPQKATALAELEALGIVPVTAL